MKYLAVIWNPVFTFKDEIEKDICKYGTIINRVDLDLNPDIFKDFIVELYNYPQEESWKTDYKIKDLTVYDTYKIRILEIEIKRGKYIINSKGKKVLEKAQELKDYIRNNYNYTIVDNKKVEIYKENALHLTDNMEEYKYQKQVVDRYLHMTFINDLDSAKFYDSLPRFSKNVYDYLKSIGVDNSIVADVGSGTGRITIDLLEEGNTVYAIDPDSNMRSICDNKCSHFDKYISIEGMDSKMNIPDKSVDYVIVSQSYHRFNPTTFKEECNRVLKDPKNVIIIWYRVDLTNPIHNDMLNSIKRNYSDYETRYDTDEITGAKKEEEDNNRQADEFLGGSHMENVMSTPYLTKDEFLTLGLSLALFPITHKLNNTSDVLKQKSFNKENYVKDLEEIFDKYQKDNKIKLEFNVQIHSKN